MKKMFLSLGVTGVIIIGTFLLVRTPQKTTLTTTSSTNISIDQGKQIIAIMVKGGYTPRETVATANKPTTLRLTTNGTFDCSSAVRIPQLSYQANLGANGTTEVQIPPQQPGTELRGVCAMGMYHFTLSFK